MRCAIITFSLAAAAIALPQIPPSATLAPKPTITTPTATTTLALGQLPRDGLKTLPWSDFGAFASQLGFDPAKASPNPSGPADQKCQSSPNGNFCFGPSGGSFSLGHPGGAFNGENFNPFPGSTGTAGGLLIGSIGSAEDGASEVREAEPGKGGSGNAV